MKKIIIILSLIPCLAVAQQKPKYTQYIINNYIINPAITGIENYTDIKLSHRRQWVGLDDAPVSSYFTAHTPLGKKDEKLTSTSYAKDGVNLRGKQYWDEYEASPAHHGVGIQIVNDRTGPLQNTGAMATYAYHIGLTPKLNLSAGVGIGVNTITLNTSKLFFGTDFPVDPAVSQNGLINKAKVDANIGVWLYSNTYFFGVSAQQIVPSKIDYSNNIVKQTEGKQVPHIFATAGYRIQLNDDISILPSTMVKYVSPAPVQIDANLKAQYQDLIWAGVNYRFSYGASAFVGVNAMNRVTISYAYDYTTTKINTVSKGTHEIILGFTIGNKYNTNTCPSRVW